MSFEIKKGVLKQFSPEMIETDITIPEGVTVIGAKAFVDGADLHSVAIPKGVEEIKQYAFYLIDSRIASISLPASLKKLAKNALPDELESIVFPAGKMIFFMPHESYECSEIAAYILGIGDKDFSELRAGSRLEIAACALVSPELFPESSLPVIEKYLKSQKKKILEIIWDKESPEALKGMADRNFLSAKDIDELLNRKIGNAEIKAFLLNLKNEKPVLLKEKDPFAPLTVSEAKKDWTFVKNEAGDGYKITSYKGKDSGFSIPEQIGKFPVKEVEGFCNCGYSSKIPYARQEWMQENIEKISFPESLEIIGPYSCMELESLQSIIIANSVTAIGKSSFEGCISLTEIRLPEGLLSLDYNAFSNCTGLKDAYLPASLSEINYLSFSRCPNLTIHAPAGSYAEQYAKENGIAFIAE